jgi:hypothetical protein
MNWPKITLFLSGLFFGGAIDHVILAVMGSDITPYGFRSGLWGNWALAGLDMGVTVLLYTMHRRLEKERQ